MKKIFFSASIYFPKHTIFIYEKVCKSVIGAGGKVVADWIDNFKKNDKKESDKRSKIYPDKFFDYTKDILSSDAVIADVSHLTVGVGYQIFFAHLNKKPVLALYDGRLINKKKIGSIINLDSHYLILRKYNEKNLSIIVSNFIKSYNHKLSKFNFMINDEIKKYINWLEGKNSNMSKSELLREAIIKKIIYADGEYQKFLNK